MKMTLKLLKEKKQTHQKIIALTAYDYPTTMIIERANIDMIILGDSVGTNVLGYKNETEVTLGDMIHHTKAVCRAKNNIFLVVDLPYNTYQTIDSAVRNAKQLIDIGADAVKFEGINKGVLSALKKHNINVMCHIGLNPQHDQERMSLGKITKGKFLNEATDLLTGAKILENEGADLIILEKIPWKISKIITENIKIPTIGIGAGKYCDGQVLIIHDLLGICEKKYKHVPVYVDLKKIIFETISQYRNEIENDIFPNETHANLINDIEYNKIKDWCIKNDFTI